MHSDGINWWGVGSQYAENPALGWYIITFVTFIGVLIYYARGPLSQYLADRAQGVRDAIEEGAKARDEAIRFNSAQEKRLSTLATDIKSEFALLQAEGLREKAELEAEGKKQAELIRHYAKETVAMELRQAERALRRDIARMVVAELKETMHSAKVTPTMDAALSERLLTEIDRRAWPNSGGVRTGTGVKNHA
jgi:F0F1-type ATP synthase membrane subunit b/b'